MTVEILGGDNEKPVSYSAFTSFVQCGKAFQLQRELGVVEAPAWYSVGGSAVHAATEKYDLEQWRKGKR